MTQTPTDLVARQLAAYNAREIEAFMACWSDTCRIHAFPATLLAEGAAALRARHVARFQEPNLHGHLVARLAVGPTVVDQEVVTRTFPEGPGEIDVLAIYEVVDGTIAQAWFQMGPPRLAAGPGWIVPSGPEDAALVRALTRAAYAKWVPVVGREPRPMTADYDAAVRAHRIDRLVLDGQTVALIELAPHPDHLLIVNVAVDPAHQGRGHGRTLLAHAERVAAALGLPELRLYTNGRFEANVALYERLGYRITATEPFMGSTTVWMAKRP